MAGNTVYICVGYAAQIRTDLPAVSIGSTQHFLKVLR